MMSVRKDLQFFLIEVTIHLSPGRSSSTFKHRKLGSDARKLSQIIILLEVSEHLSLLSYIRI
jgi:hypothetical protein